ncbi:MAG: hypothetical protein M3506_09430 [Chloroflexota bacterium]|nr:hypothetical protein [Chloroflexota bacterium]
MTPDETRARLVDIALQIRRAERRKEHDLVAQLEAEYTRRQEVYAAMLDAADTAQGHLWDGAA